MVRKIGGAVGIRSSKRLNSNGTAWTSPPAIPNAQAQHRKTTSAQSPARKDLPIESHAADISNQFGVTFCPECKTKFNDSTFRPVQEGCGHIKCRSCLIRNEDGCKQCKRSAASGSTLVVTRVADPKFPSSNAIARGSLSNNAHSIHPSPPDDPAWGTRLETVNQRSPAKRKNLSNPVSQDTRLSFSSSLELTPINSHNDYGNDAKRCRLKEPQYYATPIGTSGPNQGKVELGNEIAPPPRNGITIHRVNRQVGQSLDSMRSDPNNASPKRHHQYNQASISGGTSNSNPNHLPNWTASLEVIGNPNHVQVRNSSHISDDSDGSQLGTICPTQLQQLQLPDQGHNEHSSPIALNCDNSNSTTEDAGENCQRSSGGEKKKKKRSPVFIHEHIKILSGDPQMYQCSICTKKFKTKAHIKYHEFCQNGEKPFRCEQCGQGFIAKSHYEYHLRTHTGERPYVCPKCGKGFNQRGKVTRHMRSHTGEKPFHCETCGRGFANAQAMRSHYLIHTGERPFACEHCNKRFTGMTNLKKHIITHTGERPFMCVHCGKSFGLKWTLDLHMRTHSSERPYACDQCSRAFSNSKDLRRHLVIHSGERPFKCWLCGTAFRRKDNLDRHIKNTHNQPKEVAKQLANRAAAEYLACTKVASTGLSSDVAIASSSMASSPTKTSSALSTAAPSRNPATLRRINARKLKAKSPCTSVSIPTEASYSRSPSIQSALDNSDLYILPNDRPSNQQLEPELETVDIKPEPQNQVTRLYAELRTVPEAAATGELEPTKLISQDKEESNTRPVVTQTEAPTSKNLSQVSPSISSIEISEESTSVLCAMEEDKTKEHAQDEPPNESPVLRILSSGNTSPEAGLSEESSAKREIPEFLNNIDEPDDGDILDIPPESLIGWNQSHHIKQEDASKPDEYKLVNRSRSKSPQSIDSGVSGTTSSEVESQNDSDTTAKSADTSKNSANDQEVPCPSVKQESDSCNNAKYCQETQESSVDGVGPSCTEVRGQAPQRSIDVGDNQTLETLNKVKSDEEATKCSAQTPPPDNIACAPAFVNEVKENKTTSEMTDSRTNQPALTSPTFPVPVTNLVVSGSSMVTTCSITLLPTTPPITSATTSLTSTTSSCYTVVTSVCHPVDGKFGISCEIKVLNEPNAVGTTSKSSDSAIMSLSGKNSETSSDGTMDTVVQATECPEEIKSGLVENSINVESTDLSNLGGGNQVEREADIALAVQKDDGEVSLPNQPVSAEEDPQEQEKDFNLPQKCEVDPNASIEIQVAPTHEPEDTSSTQANQHVTYTKTALVTFDNQENAFESEAGLEQKDEIKPPESSLQLSPQQQNGLMEDESNKDEQEPSKYDMFDSTNGRSDTVSPLETKTLQTLITANAEADDDAMDTSENNPEIINLSNVDGGANHNATATDKQETERKDDDNFLNGSEPLAKDAEAGCCVEMEVDLGARETPNKTEVPETAVPMKSEQCDGTPTVESKDFSHVEPSEKPTSTQQNWWQSDGSVLYSAQRDEKPNLLELKLEDGFEVEEEETQLIDPDDAYDKKLCGGETNSQSLALTPVSSPVGSAELPESSEASARVLISASDAVPVHQEMPQSLALEPPLGSAANYPYKPWENPEPIPPGYVEADRTCFPSAATEIIPSPEFLHDPFADGVILLCAYSRILLIPNCPDRQILHFCESLGYRPTDSGRPEFVYAYAGGKQEISTDPNCKILMHVLTTSTVVNGQLVCDEQRQWLSSWRVAVNKYNEYKMQLPYLMRDYSDGTREITMLSQNPLHLSMIRGLPSFRYMLMNDYFCDRDTVQHVQLPESDHEKAEFVQNERHVEGTSSHNDISIPTRLPTTHEQSHEFSPSNDLGHSNFKSYPLAINADVPATSQAQSQVFGAPTNIVSNESKSFHTKEAHMLNLARAIATVGEMDRSARAREHARGMSYEQQRGGPFGLGTATPDYERKYATLPNRRDGD